MLGNTTVVLRRFTPGGRDAYGTPLETTSADTTISGCAFAPAGSGQFDRARSDAVEADTLYLPLGSPLPDRETDQFVIDGRAYRIKGRPASWTSQVGSNLGGIVVALEYAEG